MKIAITWDYELFFGEKSGSVEKCMLQPTSKLLALAKEMNIPFTFFPDIGSLISFEQHSDLNASLHQIKDQIKAWDIAGHETGLHIHPHWEKAKRKNGFWLHDLNYYKLSDFTHQEANAIVANYHNNIQSLVQSKVISYRAGGWCIQPFIHTKSAFESCGIRVDSSIFKNGKNEQTPYNYNFSDFPNLEKWNFDSNELKPRENGTFTELPIDSQLYSPFFFWKLFILGRLFPKTHKPIGDGIPAKGGGSKFDLLTKSHVLCVSADGFFASELQRVLKKKNENKDTIMIVIGHPKALTEYSLSALKKFISQNKNEHSFVTLSQLI